MFADITLGESTLSEIRVLSKNLGFELPRISEISMVTWVLSFTCSLQRQRIKLNNS